MDTPKDTTPAEQKQPASIENSLQDADVNMCEKALGDILDRSIGRIFTLANGGAPVVPIRVEFPEVVYISEEHGELYIGVSRIGELGIVL